MPPAASNKRNRATSPSSSSSQPPKSKPRTSNYHPGFEKTARSDIILSSSDGWHYATSKIYLQANSSVFEDALLVGTDESTDRIDGLPVINLEELSYLLRRYLSFLHVPVVKPSPIGSLETLDSLLKLCDKMDSPLIGRAASNHYFPSLFRNVDGEGDGDVNKMDLFALALIWSRYETRTVVEDCLKSLGMLGVVDPKVDRPPPWHDASGEKEEDVMGAKGWRPYNIQDLDLALLERMDLRDVMEFSRLRDRVLSESTYSWADAANDFKIHGYP